MDRELDASYQIWPPGAPGGCGRGGPGALRGGADPSFPGWLRPSSTRERSDGKVDRGPVEGIIEASGTVMPAFEGVISSPVEARVEKILKRPGELVKAGEEILALDTSLRRLDLGTARGPARPKKANEQQQLRISLEKSLTICADRSRPEARRRGARLSRRAEPQAARRRARLGADAQGVRGGGEEGADPARPAPRLGRERPPLDRCPARRASISISRRCARSATTPGGSSSSPPPARTARASSPGSSPRRARRCGGAM